MPTKAWVASRQRAARPKWRSRSDAQWQFELIDHDVPVRGSGANTGSWRHYRRRRGLAHQRPRPCAFFRIDARLPTIVLNLKEEIYRLIYLKVCISTVCRLEDSGIYES